MPFVFTLTLIAFLGLCAIFALLILIQKGRGGGISAAFGGAGGNTAFGSKTGDVLTWATSVIFFLFLSLCVVLNWQAASVNAAYLGKTATAKGSNEAADTNAPAPAAPTKPAPTTQIVTATPANIDATATTKPAPAKLPGGAVPSDRPVSTQPTTPLP